MSHLIPKLLIVDDESTHQLALMDILEASDKSYEILSAFTAKEALKIALKEMPDLIVSDWEMPEMDGIDFIKCLKADERLQAIPVIMCTGIMTDSAHLQCALEAGANDYVRKPLDAVEVLARINATLCFRDEQHKRICLEKEMWQRELEMQHQSLAVTKANLMHNGAYVDEVVAQLKAISGEVSFKCHLKIQDLISKIKSDMPRSSWQDLEHHFEKIHPSFLVNLKQQYPKLTQNEVELCMYYKLNMTTSEMQAISYKSEEALKKARQRLKKKLDLHTPACIYSAMQKF